jgi:hypothetical protein
MRANSYAKSYFMSCLKAYREALESGESRRIVVASLAIHAASGNVPRSYRRLVNQTFRATSSQPQPEPSGAPHTERPGPAE